MYILSFSAASNKKRQRSPLTTPSSSERHSNSIIYDEMHSPIIEPSRKKQRFNCKRNDSSINITSDDLPEIPSTSRKVVHFAPSSAVEYELEAPVCQSLTPIPAATADRRYPTEMKALTIEEAELIQITKQNSAILKVFDDMYDSDTSDNTRVQRRRNNRKNRRKSFYISSKSCQSSDRNPFLNTI